MNLPVDLIVVPQGAEYQAVKRGLDKTGCTTRVLPIPIGVKALGDYFRQPRIKLGEQLPTKVLVMGLCGSLSPNYGVGDVVLYQDCRYASDLATESTQIKLTDPKLTHLISSLISKKVSLVSSLTSDRIIDAAAEKLSLGQRYQAEVVDMEGTIILETLAKQNIGGAMLRVVSDDCNYDLPQLNRALDLDRGRLRSLSLMITMLRQPLPAMRLIRGAVKGLQVLEQIATELG